MVLLIIFPNSHAFQEKNKETVTSFLKTFYLFIFREGKGGRKWGKETSMCKTNINWLPLAHPQLGTWPTTQACAWQRIKPVTFQFAGGHSIHWATPTRGKLYSYNEIPLGNWEVWWGKTTELWNNVLTDESQTLALNLKKALQKCTYFIILFLWSFRTDKTKQNNKHPQH